MARRAVLVGINDYRRLNDLEGCLNDVGNVRSVLRAYLGFENADIRVLADGRATRANILERLRWLVDGARGGDFLLFHFSGHGSQIRDRDGDELRDGMDELLCPWDMDWDGTFLTDDDLQEVLGGVPAGATLEVLLDCCHAGTGLREAGPGPHAAPGPAGPGRPRYLPPPLDVACRHEGEEDALGPPRGVLSGTRVGAAGNQILWAGCRSDQTSADAELGGTPNGAFTYFFCKHLRAGGGRLGRRELLARVRASLRHGGFSQVPQLECRAAEKQGRPLGAGAWGGYPGTTRETPPEEACRRGAPRRSRWPRPPRR